MRKRVLFGALLLCITTTQSLLAAPYGISSYGDCGAYGEGCNTISLGTSGSVALELSPTSTGVYSIEKDEVTVTTTSNSGYELRISSSSATTNSLENGASLIAATNGSSAAPAPLAVNEWGYRVDGEGEFGVGPTVAAENQLTNTALFAAVPLLGNEDVVKATSTSALSGDTTTIWYGVRADITRPAGTYSATVLYTATPL